MRPAGLGVPDGDGRLALARLRLEIRQIDREMRKVQREHRSFRRLGFGSEVHEIQLTALRDQRKECQQKVREIRRRWGLRRLSQQGLLCWVLLPLLLLLFLFQPFLPRRRAKSAEARFLPQHRSLPQIS